MALVTALLIVTGCCSYPKLWPTGIGELGIVTKRVFYVNPDGTRSNGPSDKGRKVVKRGSRFVYTRTRTHFEPFAYGSLDQHWGRLVSPDGKDSLRFNMTPYLKKVDGQWRLRGDLFSMASDSPKATTKNE